jgi:hypothetical protein
MAAKRKVGIIILGIILGSVIGSALSFILGSVFPKGPVNSFFFNALRVGFSTVTIDIGFIAFTLGLHINITMITIAFIFLMIYLLYKL